MLKAGRLIQAEDRPHNSSHRDPRGGVRPLHGLTIRSFSPRRYGVPANTRMSWLGSPALGVSAGAPSGAGGFPS